MQHLNELTAESNWHDVAQWVRRNQLDQRALGLLKAWLIDHSTEVNFQDEQGNTLLHIAAASLNKEVIAVLIESGATPYLTNNQFQFPWHLIPDGTILEDLLSGNTSKLDTFHPLSPIASRVEMRRYLKEVLAECVNAISEQGWQYDMVPARLLIIVGRLVGRNVETLLMDPTIRVKLPAHVFEIGLNDVLVDAKMSKQQNAVKVDLEGFDTKLLLPIGFYSLFISLLKETFAASRGEQNEKLFEELVITFEMNLLLSYLDKRRTVAAHTDNDQTFKLLAADMLKKMTALQEGEELAIPSGWSEHSLYVNFFRKQDRYYLRVDNLGGGIRQSFTRHDYSTATQQARAHLAILRPLDQAGDAMLGYLANVLYYAFHLISGAPLTGNVEIQRQNILKKLYDSDHRIATNQRLQGQLLDDFAPLLRIQRVGNCVYKSYWARLRVRLGSSLLRTHVEPSYARLMMPNEMATEKHPAVMWPVVRGPIMQRVQSLMQRRSETILQTKRALDAVPTPLIAPHLQVIPEKKEGLFRFAEFLSVGKLFARPVSSPSSGQQQTDELPVNRLLILSPAGMGKSTLCRFLADQWGQSAAFLSSQFDAMIWLPLRELKSKGADAVYSVIDFVAAQCFDRPLYWYESVALKRMVESSKTLWVLDGLDELVLTPEIEPVFAELLQKRHSVITSRPNHPLLARVEPSQRLSLCHFSDEDIQRYVQACFPDAEQSRVLLSSLQANPMLYRMAQTPISLYLLCSLWAQNTSVLDNIHTLTQLHEQVFDWSLSKAYSRQYGPDAQVLNRLDVQRLYSDVLKVMDRLAFESLKGGRQVSLDAQLVQSIIKRLCGDDPAAQQQLFDKMRRTGLCLLDWHGGEFVHPTSQEFFAARYVMRKLMKKTNHANREVIEFIRRHKLNPDYQVLFAFVAGLLSEASMREVGRMKAKRMNALNAFFDILNQEPYALLGAQDKQTRLLMACFDETQCNSNIHCAAELIAVAKAYLESALLSDSGSRVQDFTGKTYLLAHDSLKQIVLEVLERAQPQNTHSVLAQLANMGDSVPLNQSILSKLLDIIAATDQPVASWFTQQQYARVVQILHANLPRLIALSKQQAGWSLIRIPEVLKLSTPRVAVGADIHALGLVAAIFKKLLVRAELAQKTRLCAKSAFFDLCTELCAHQDDSVLPALEALVSGFADALTLPIFESLYAAPLQVTAFFSVSTELYQFLSRMITRSVKAVRTEGAGIRYDEKRFALLNTLLGQLRALRLDEAKLEPIRNLFTAFFEQAATRYGTKQGSSRMIDVELLQLMGLSSLQFLMPTQYHDVLKCVYHFAQRSYTEVSASIGESASGKKSYDYTYREQFARQIASALRALGHLSIPRNVALSAGAHQVVSMLLSRLRMARGIHEAALYALARAFDVSGPAHIDEMLACEDALIQRVAKTLQPSYRHSRFPQSPMVQSYNLQQLYPYPVQAPYTQSTIDQDAFIAFCNQSANETIREQISTEPPVGFGLNLMPAAKPVVQTTYSLHQLSIRLLILAYLSSDKAALLDLLSQALEASGRSEVMLTAHSISLDGEALPVFNATEQQFNALFEVFVAAGPSDVRALYATSAAHLISIQAQLRGVQNQPLYRFFRPALNTITEAEENTTQNQLTL